TCSPKWVHSERTERVTISGQCVNSNTELNVISATTGRVRKPKIAPIGLGARISRHIHAGIPETSNGAATSVNSRCWNMCAEYRYRSARSWIGEAGAVHSDA